MSLSMKVTAEGLKYRVLRKARPRREDRPPVGAWILRRVGAEGGRLELRVRDRSK